MSSWDARLLGGGSAEALDDHLRVQGPLPASRGRRRASLIEAVTASGLRGRGGGGFPAGLKLAAVARERGARVVLANGAEGEPASRKDALLLAARPHLVLDGAVLCARAVGAADVVVAVAGGAAVRSVERAVAERADGVSISVARVPDRFLAGEETALISYLSGRDLLPTPTPPHPSARGLRRRPTLVQNVETLAHVALIARHGPDWFRGVGVDDDPGTALVTLCGAVPDPGVCECPSGVGLGELLEAGGVTSAVRAVLVGGYFGEWVDAREARLVRLETRWRGAGVIAVLPASACGPFESARALAYLAGEGSGQCGPCSNGLPAIAAMFARLVDGSAPPDALADLRRWAAVVPGRGACRLPDGAVRFASSALRVFAAEFADHARHGFCDRCLAAPVLPLPGGQSALAT